MKAKSAYFVNSNLEKIDYVSAIVPLITKEKYTQKIIFIGTAFYISKGGILITARHNLFYEEGKLFDSLAIIHFTNNQEFVIRQIHNATHSESYDIAYLVPWMKLTNKGMSSAQSLTLTNYTPEVNDQLGLYGYPDTRLSNYADTTIVDFSPKFYLGSCTDFHRNGFGILKNPCFQTNIKIKSGASGGPIFDKNGKVFAVASTGYDLDNEVEEDLSFVTPIEPTFGLKIKDVNGKESTVFELMDRGLIQLS
jgi:V8-like Glu-specific endopeptidase